MERPLTHGENLRLELDTLNDVAPRLLRLLEIFNQVAGLTDVSEHGLDFRDDIVAALNLQLLDDGFFSLVINTELIE